MNDFYVILRLDWLPNRQASVDCFTKKVVLKKSRYLDLEFEDDRKFLPTCVISVFEAKRLLHTWCEVYLAHVIDKLTPEVVLDSVSVVRKFLDIFSKDLSGLPLDRELEFEIELLPGPAPVSILLYRMAPAEFSRVKESITGYDRQMFHLT